MRQTAAFSLQGQPALHKLRLLVWPDLGTLHLKALRKAAPQLQIVTVGTTPRISAFSPALRGTSTLSTAPPFSHAWYSEDTGKPNQVYCAISPLQAYLLDQRHSLQES